MSALASDEGDDDNDGGDGDERGGDAEYTIAVAQRSFAIDSRRRKIARMNLDLSTGQECLGVLNAADFDSLVT